MKKTIIVCAVILAIILTGCGVVNNAVVVEKQPITDISAMLSETPMVEVPTVENMSTVVEKNKEQYPFYRVVDVDTFVEYLNSEMPACTFTVQQHNENYFDDYFGVNISEYGYIVGTFEETFDMLVFSISFIDNEIADFSMTVNIPDTMFFDEYKEFVNTVLMEVGISYGLSEGQLVEYEKTFMPFDSYKPNIYGNPESSACYNDDVVALAVIFEGGKDIEFKGVSYYFVSSTLM